MANVQPSWQQPQPVLRNKRMLVVEDNQTIQQIIQQRATAWGMVTESAANAAEAVQALQTQADFDLVVIDCQLPGKDGLELAAEMRARPAGRFLPIILLTSNAATETMMKLTADPETMPSPEGLVKAMKPELDKVFKPAFLGRLVIVPYYPVRDEALKKIITLKLGKIQRRMAENHKVALEYTPGLVNAVADRCTEVESGARNVDHIITGTLLPEISREFLSRMAEGHAIESVHVRVDESGKFAYDIK